MLVSWCWAASTERRASERASRNGENAAAAAATVQQCVVSRVYDGRTIRVV